MNSKEELKQYYAILSIAESLKRIERILMPTVRASAIEFFTLIGGRKTRVVHMFLKVTDKLPLSLSIVDAAGNPAKVDGVPAWSVTDEEAAELKVSEDGMSAELFPKGKVAKFDVQVKADADLGEGVKELLGTLDIETLSGEAVSMSLVAGPAVPM